MQYYQEALALGSKTGMSLVSDVSPGQIDRLYKTLWKAVFIFEKRFSRFLPSSELSEFNRKSGLKQSISPEFRDILLAAKGMAQKTSGLYNPFVLPLVQSVGYKYSRVPGHETDVVDDHSDKLLTTADKLIIGDDWAQIPYGTAIDLGGCGKGYLADLVANQLPENIKGYWLSFGGDIALGGHDDSGRPWTVKVESAANSASNIAQITTDDVQAVATSGTIVHRGKKAAGAWHHLIDPRTRRPAETDILLATVCDGSALNADVLASCAVILGSKKGLQFLKKHGVKAAVIQCRNDHNEAQIFKFGDSVKIGESHA
jgi:thiamine biosynthesis lipoprotein